MVFIPVRAKRFWAPQTFKGEGVLVKMEAIFICSLQKVIKLKPTTTDGLRSHLTVTCIQQVFAGWTLPLLPCCLFKLSQQGRHAYFNPSKVLSDANGLKEWSPSLSADNLMLTQVTCMHETPREYYKLGCHEVVNWMRQTKRLVLPPWKGHALPGQRWPGKLCRWDSVTGPNDNHRIVSVLVPGVWDGLG